MKHFEFYTKYKTSYPPLVNSIFVKGKGWLILLITVLAVLVEPLVIMYKHQRPGPFSVSRYLELAGYLLLMASPFIGFLYWINWRELSKRHRGYCWIGKFQVIDKQTVFPFQYLLLKPGVNNKVKIDNELSKKIRVGDFIRIRKDAFGKIEEVSRITNFYRQLTKAKTKRIHNH